MKRLINSAVPLWNELLLASVLCAAFVVPALPPHLHGILFRIVYSIIYVAAVFSLRRRSHALLALFAVTFLLEWISGIFGLQLLLVAARGMNFLFFLVIVFSLIRQIAAAKEVTAAVILGSMIGYLLIGIMYSIFVSLIMQYDPTAFSMPVPASPSLDPHPDVSTPLYFGFVTLATLGYGDIVPVKPYARSLATLITVSGQFYIAIIIALLVGKFSVQRGASKA
jgi:voltage-gated potassium channel